MRYGQRLTILFLIVLPALCLISCTEKKEGKVIVTDQEFSIRQDAEYNWVIDAKGKIRNVGDVDVKKVVVTGYCRSCSEIWSAGIWLVSDNVEKSSDQKDTISYLTAGNEEEFSFKEVAFFFRPGGPGPEGMIPDNLEIVIESFETVE
jgi:hypothetical protein